MLQGLAKAKALKELQALIKDKASLKGLALTKALKRQNELRNDLGMGKWQQVAENKAPLNVNDIQPLLIDDPSEVKKAVEKYLSQFKDKYITTIDGKNVVFNGKGRNHLANDVVFGENIIAGAIEKVVEVLTQGQFIEVQDLDKKRYDSFIAFHVYRKWVQVDNQELHLQVKVGQLKDGTFEVGNGLIAYSAKNAENEKAITPPTTLFDSVSINSGAYRFPNDSIMLDSASQEDYVFLEILEVKPLQEGWDDKTADIPQTAYQLHDKPTATKRQKDNDTAVALMRELQETGRKATSEEKAILSRYTGTGGNLVGEDGLKGSAYEYYTPKEVASQMWGLLAEHGFKGGVVLDPSAGTGVFSSVSPQNTIVHNVELSDVSGGINGLINDNHKVTISPFEKIASSTENEIYDTVITNVPFGEVADRGANRFEDKLYQNDTLEEYFIKRSLDKLKPNGLACFIVPKKILDGSRYAKFRTSILLRADLLGAYRLPNKVFHSTGADVTTDIIVLKKFSTEIANKIEALNETGSKVLKDAKVLDTDIIAGKYFKTYGAKYILGKTAKAKGQWGDVEQVINDDSLPNILKLVKKFPDSRIDYAMLDVEPMPEEVNFGSVRVIDGQTYELKDGVWEMTKEAVEFDETPFKSFYDLAINNVTLSQFDEYKAYLSSVGRILPHWLEHKAKNDKEFKCWAVLSAVADVLKVESSNGYYNNHKELSTAMTNIDLNIKKFSKLKNAVSIAFDESNPDKLSKYWKTGNRIVLETLNKELTSQQAYEKAIYNGNAEDWQVDIDVIKQSNPDFNPLSSEDFCINADGTKVTLAKDYYVGNYGEFLERIDKEIENADDVNIRAKLVLQKEEAKKRVENINVSNMQFGLMSSLIPMEMKYRFFSEFISQYTGFEDGKLVLNDKDKNLWGAISYDHTNSPYMKHYLLNRVFVSINNNQKLGIDSRSAEDVETRNLLTEKLIKYYNELNIQFNTWVKTDVAYMAELSEKLNNPKTKDFILELSGTPIEIENFNPKYENFKSLHDYQFEEVKRLSRSFSGICGFDVGLGKTATALATVQNVHNIGIKKRTFIVVPNHTISKWYKDMKNVYDDVSDVLVIGSNNNQNEDVKSAYRGKDLALLTKEAGKGYRKILMTVEAFADIPLKDGTITTYFETDGDEFHKKVVERESSRMAGIKKKLNKYEGSLPYFEDLGVDSIVFDEAQIFKNGMAGGSDFDRISGISQKSETSTSARGLSARAKAWYIRNQNKLKDGVVLLTATPFTNSPVEIVTMLSLAIGDDKAMQAFGGDLFKDMNDFLHHFASVEELVQRNIIQEVVSKSTFTGFQNAQHLKKIIHNYANIQNAKDRGLKIPDEEHIITSVDLPERDKRQLDDLKDFYKIAKMIENDGPYHMHPKYADYLEYKQKTKEDDALIGHAFSLINRMSELTLVGSDMAISRQFRIKFKDLETAKKVVKEFNNSKNLEFTTTRRYTLSSDYISETIKKMPNGEQKIEYAVKAEASIDGNEIVLNVDDSSMIARLMKIIEDNSLNIEPKLSVKVQALIENVKVELANPKHLGHSKQLIFCDTLSMHHILKHSLIAYAGVKSSEIAILNAQTLPNGRVGTPDTEDVQEIQDLFKDNHYTIVIANKKAETGIDLQHGTQAIHHLTTGWTPDSLHQRNGRGVRQGNKLDFVNIYHYNANGTFDEYKRQIINNKADWIGSLMDKDEVIKGTLRVAQELSDQDYEDMIEANSPEKIAEIMQLRKQRENEQWEKQRKENNDLLYRDMLSAREISNKQGSINNELERVLLSEANQAIFYYEKWDKAKSDEMKDKYRSQYEDIIKSIEDLIKSKESIDRLQSLIARRAEKKRKDDKKVWRYDLEDIFNFRTLTGSFESKLAVVLGNLNKDSGIHKKAERVSNSKKEMARVTRERFINNEDSPFSLSDREAIADGKAIINGDEVFYNGDFLEAEAGERYYIFDANQPNSYKECRLARDRAKALDYFATRDVEEYNKKKNIYSHSNVIVPKDLGYSKLSVDVENIVTERLFNVLNERKFVNVNRLFHVDTKVFYLFNFGILGGIIEKDEVFKEFEKSYLEVFDGLPVVDGDRVHISDNELNKLGITIKEESALFPNYESVSVARFLKQKDMKLNFKIDLESIPALIYTTLAPFAEEDEAIASSGLNGVTFVTQEEYDNIVSELMQYVYGSCFINAKEIKQVEYLPFNLQTYVKRNVKILQDGEAVNDIMSKAEALALKSPYGIKMVALKDKEKGSRILFKNKEKLKKIAEKVGDNRHRTFNGEQSAWYVSLEAFAELIKQDWLDFEEVDIQVPIAYEGL